MLRAGIWSGRSTLVDDTLKLSGKGITVNNAMLFEGDLTQTLNLIPSEYVEGLKSSFEDGLITDVNDPNYGKYKVEYKVTGKNKFELDGDVTGGAVYYRRSEPILKKGITYTISHDCKRVYDEPPVMSLCDKSGASKHSTFLIDSSKYTFTALDDIYNIYLYSNGFSYVNSINNSMTFSNIQIEEGTSFTYYEPYKEYTKTFYLNSPLLEGDTIEDINGKATHVHRRGSKLLDGSEEGWYLWDVSSSLTNTIAFAMPTNGKNGVNEADNSSSVFGNTICDKFIESNEIIDSEWHMTHSNITANNRWWSICINKTKLSTQDVTGFKQWLQANPTTVVYQLASPIYETISDESILCDSYVNGHLGVDTNIPIERVQFLEPYFRLNYLNNDSIYTVRFISDSEGILDWIDLGGYSLRSQRVIKGINKFTINSPASYNVLYLGGIGFNASNIQVVETDKEFGYFEGMKSVGECEDNKIEILGRNKNLFDKDSDINFIANSGTNLNVYKEVEEDYIRLKYGGYGIGAYLTCNVNKLSKGTYTLSCECYCGSENASKSIALGYRVDNNNRPISTLRLDLFNTWEI